MSLRKSQIRLHTKAAIVRMAWVTQLCSGCALLAYGPGFNTKSLFRGWTALSLTGQQESASSQADCAAPSTVAT